VFKALWKVAPLLAMMWWYGTKQLCGWTWGKLYSRVKDRHAKTSKRGSVFDK
jgi:hypothetical protein